MSEVKTSCTQVCGKPEGTSKSCQKIPVQLFREENPNLVRTVYAIIDDQNSHSLVTSNLFDMFRDFGPDIEYSFLVPEKLQQVVERD